MDIIRIGTRGSKLALKQAALVQEALLRADSRIETEIVVVHTKGDKIQDRPLIEIGEKGVFASELEHALLNKQIDIAVHSAKDLPMVLAEGLVIGAVLPRADVRDVLVIPKGGRKPILSGSGGCAGAVAAETCRKAGTEQGAGQDVIKDTNGQEDGGEPGRAFVIGSGSRRRQMLAGQLWDNVVCENIRGNVDTRLRKLRDGSGDGTVYDGIILAKAGLDRLGIGSGQEEGFTFCPLLPEQFLPAACQGIIAAETLQDSAAAMLCRKITDAETELCFAVERETLARLSADCSEAIAAWCRRQKDGLALDVMYAGNRQRLTSVAEVSEGLEMARKAAQLVKGEGT